MQYIFDDFILNVDARLVSGLNSNYYGLIFRHKDDDNFYRFLVRGDGYYFIGKRLNGELTQVQGWTSASSIKEGTGSNHLMVFCNSSQIKLIMLRHLTPTT